MFFLTDNRFCKPIKELLGLVELFKFLQPVLHLLLTHKSSFFNPVSSLKPIKYFIGQFQLVTTNVSELTCTSVKLVLLKYLNKFCPT